MRLFVAIDLPESVKESLVGLCRGIPDARWASPHTMHLTLAFIGEVGESDFQNIRDELHQVHFDSFSLELEGVGNFSKGGAKPVVWVGTKKNPQLSNLQIAVEKKLLSLGIPKEKREYFPHITLARLNTINHGRLEEYMNLYSSFTTPPFEVIEFHLYSSRLKPEGPVHFNEETYHADNSKTNKPIF